MPLLIWKMGQGLKITTELKAELSDEKQEEQFVQTASC